MFKRACIGAGVLVLVAGLLFPVVVPTHWPRPYVIIESLNQPLGVAGWEADGLKLVDGRQIALPGIKRLPVASEALSRATQHGVEVAGDGRVFGLVRIHHWCGNDPVRTHLARVDIAHMVIYMREVAFDFQSKELSDSRDHGIGLPYSEFGWRVGDYYSFRVWSELATSNGI